MSSGIRTTDLEKLIAEARAAEEAGVFVRTAVDCAALVQTPAPSRLIKFYERALVALPLAACVAIALGLATLTGSPMTSPQPTTLGGSVMATAEPVSAPCDIELVATCISGPGLPASDECSCVDYDRDGDVDMLDMSSYQRQVARAD